ncbi:probable ATP-dependent RNA helicase spindle-E isoform X1 [Helicoverpa zea]|uniref:probable ATP-dependent RNA helicase spindle-E isoform X1 n=1 Tax=Helicoverpa zea TaxID=7113 RepID=UPI001F55F83D|nr:probable ATP-dependent RNA helicase spindle-E isoform X1 [Helicoverpa zea]
MDELRGFLMNPSPSSSQVTRLRGPLTGGMRIVKHEFDDLNRKEEHRHSEVVSGGTEYAREARQRETELYLRNAAECYENQDQRGPLDSMDHMSSVGASSQTIPALADEAMLQVYNKYSFQRKEDTNHLPINEYKAKIVDTIRANQVVILEGPTGCGKTTQVPQWILDNCYKCRQPCKIVVTQPRRIAAISIAKRVAQERGWDVGGVVGYQVGLDAHVSNDTRISYVTTGILLQKLVASKTMNEYTHVILDEVHERGQEMDFLLLIVKRLAYTSSPHVKVVLMSATFDKIAFADYFKVATTLGLERTNCITIEKGDPMFTVKKFYLDHLHKFGTVPEPKAEDPCIVTEMHHIVLRLLNAFEGIDKQEDQITDRSQADLPSVLIFLPGIHEIEDLYTCLTDFDLREKIVGAHCRSYKWYVLPLHSTITADEQARVFQRVQPGHRKIILATNIAESSITVPDIKYVIDYCLMKIMVADPDTNFTSLRLAWASKTNCEQRAGRAGRVRDGRVYRMVSEKFYEGFRQEIPPEIIRCPLERLVLLAKMMDMGPPADVLALAMDPPDISNIHRTVLVLKEIGALKKTVDGEWSSMDGDMTYLGRVAARLPVDVKLSKLIILGYIYGCLEETVVMAAAMSVKNLFNSPFRERLNAYNSKLTWADGSTSDCIAFLNVYKVWTVLRQQQFFRAAGQSEPQWARRFYVQARALRELDELARDLRRRLATVGIDPPNGKSPWNKHELALLYKILIAGAFYPQYFVQASEDESRERDAVRTLGGLDPRTTVYLKNFPDNQPGEVYAAAIKKAVYKTISEEPRVTFDTGSRKVYLTFNEGVEKNGNENSRDPSIPGQVVLPVYKAIKARQLRIDIRIPLLPLEKAQALANAFAVDKMSLDLEKVVPRLPEIDDTHFPLKISQLTSISKFWVQYADESTATELCAIQTALNTGPLVAHTAALAPGDLVAAPYTDAGRTEICRVRVRALLPRDMIEVQYIDYGSAGCVHVCNVRTLPSGACRVAPPLAMRCRLAALAPSPLLDPHERYTPAATHCFTQLARRGRLLAKVYSVVHGVVAIDLLAEGGQLNVNEELIKRGFAVPCEESYESKMNHDLREMAYDLNLAQKRAHNREQMELAYYQLNEIEPPRAKDCNTDVCLKGPHSPLETTVHTMMYASRDIPVRIEWNSVNSVLLDTEPQEKYMRLLVAGDVGCNEGNTRLTLRHTTLMPNIPGLPAILALLFCPVAELRRNAAGTRYVSALCGLGSAECGRPYLPEHDLLVDIDADLTVDDIGLINHIRHLMDYMLYCSDGQDQPVLDPDFPAKAPGVIRQDLMALLKKRRKHRQPECVPQAWEWRSVPEDDILEISVPDMGERSVIYPLHAPTELYPVARDVLLELKKENDQLKLLVSRTPVSSNMELTCKLCGTNSMSLHAMRIHLYSTGHREKEQDFRSLQS